MAVTGIQKSYYKATGFTMDSPLPAPGLLKITAAAVTIVKGDAIFDDTNGLATNATTAFGPTFMGIAACDCASGGDCYIIPASANVRYWVVNSGATLAATTDIGEVIDLEENNTVDVSDVTVTASGWGFFVDEIDVSAGALAADAEIVTTGGFVKGHFVRT
jgi:hypothetical protein